MNFKLTVALTILLLVALLAYLITPQKTNTSKVASGATTTLLDPKPGDIVSITISRYDVEEHTFVKDGNQWKFAGNAKGDADNDQLSNIAGALQNLAYTEKFTPEEKGARSADDTGVAKPIYTIKFSDKDKHEYTLYIGKRGSQGAFAVLSTTKGAPIYVLDTDPAEQLSKNTNSFRNLQVVKVDEPAITSLAIKADNNAWRVVKSGDKWLVNSPVNARANAAVVEEILQTFHELRATSFSPLSKKDAGLDPPRATVTATLSDASTPAPATTSAPASQPAGKTVVLQIGYASELSVDRSESPVYASTADSDSVFVIGSDAAKSFAKELHDVRDPAVTPLALINATDVTVSTDGKTALAASLKDATWSLSAPLAVKADAQAMSDFLNAVHGLMAIKFVDAGDLKSIGLDPPHTRIEITVPGQSQHEVILLGTGSTDPEKGKVTPAMRQGETTVFLLPSSDADKLSPDVLKFRDKQIEQLDAMKIRAIGISGPLATSGVGPATPATASAPATAPATAPAPAPAPVGPPGIALEREGTHWTAKKDGNGALTPDESTLSALLAQFTPLEANRYLTQSAPTRTPDITVTLTVLESTKPATPATPGPTTAAAASMPSTAPSTASAPSTQAALSEMLPSTIGPDAGKLVTRTLKLYKVAPSPASPSTAPATAPAATEPAAATWQAIWDNQSPAWAFEPNPALVDDLTKAIYANPGSTPAPATQPTTQPAATRP